MLVAARLRHIAGTRWGTKRYLDMDRLREQEQASRSRRVKELRKLCRCSPRGAREEELPVPRATLKSNVRTLVIHTVGVFWRTFRARSILARMSSALAVQVNGKGWCCRLR